MKHILALVDFSDYSIAAVKAAYHWSRATHSKLHVFHNAELLLPGLTPPDFRESWGKEAAREAKKEIKELLQKILGQNAGEVQVHVSTDNFLPRMLQLADTYHFQAVFLGVKGRGAFSNILSGSCVTKVMSNFSFPIAAIPRHYQATDGFDLFVSVNTELAFNSEELRTLIAPLNGHLRSMEFITIVPDGRDASIAENRLAAITEVFSGVRNCSYRLFKGGNVFDELKRIIKERANSMLVVQKGNSDYAKMFIRRSLVYELIRDVEIPVFILS